MALQSRKTKEGGTIIMNKHDFLGILCMFLKHRRPFHSQAEQRVLDWFVKEHGFQYTKGGVIRYGKLYPHIWLVAHADTVGTEGSNKLDVSKHEIRLIQKPIKPVILEVKGNYFFSDYSRLDTYTYPLTFKKSQYGQCLGADDGAGLAIIAYLANLRNDITYFIPVGEECGGIGGNQQCEAIIQSQGEMPKIVISLDRYGYHDIITHQFREQTCSLAFAEALAAQLPMHYMPSDKGSFTDSYTFYEYGSIECTNISVGYFNHHTPQESVHWTYTYKLAKCLGDVAFDKLPIEHEPYKARKAYYWWETEEHPLTEFFPHYRSKEMTTFLKAYERHTQYLPLFREICEDNFNSTKYYSSKEVVSNLLEDLEMLDSDAFDAALNEYLETQQNQEV